MSDLGPHRDTSERVPTALLAGIADRLLCAMALLTLIGAADASAGELPSATVKLPEHELTPRVSLATPGFGAITQRAYALSDPLLHLAEPYALHEMPETKTFSSKDFRPHGRSVFDADPRSGAPSEVLTVDKDLGQRLTEYKSRDHVRVLTLWETGASTVSIQTDRKGDPSLQWTSRLDESRRRDSRPPRPPVPRVRVRRLHPCHALAHLPTFENFRRTQRAALRKRPPP